MVIFARRLLFALCVFLLAAGIPAEADTIQSDGVTYRSLSEIASKLGMNSRWDSEHDTQTLKSQWTTITFHKQSRFFELNDIRVYLGYPVIQKRNRLYIPELDWQFTLSPLLIAEKSRTNPVHTIVIDPGHGGKDPGAQNLRSRLNEKDLTLDIAKRLEKVLKKNGYRVYLTRRDDRFVELEDRVRYARKKGADLFISIHFNASDNSSASGVESFAYTLFNQPSTSRQRADSADRIFRRANRNDMRNVLLAYLLQKELVDKTREKDRGVKRARFTVLEELHCPGALIELGFISHSGTARNLRSDNYIDELVTSIYSGITRYNQRISHSGS